MLNDTSTCYYDTPPIPSTPIPILTPPIIKLMQTYILPPQAQAISFVFFSPLKPLGVTSKFPLFSRLLCLLLSLLRLVSNRIPNLLGSMFYPSSKRRILASIPHFHLLYPSSQQQKGST